MGLFRCGRFASLALFVAVIGVGCTQVTGRALDEADRGPGISYFVEHQPEDGRHLERELEESLRARGLEVTSGSAAERPPGAARIVRYRDYWRWDMRMYLFDLQIEVLDARTAAIVASGRSMQSSLSAMGMTHREVVDRAVAVLLEGPPGGR